MGIVIVQNAQLRVHTLEARLYSLMQTAPFVQISASRQQYDLEHHRGTSTLLELPLDPVHDVPLDYMHVVLLGVVRKLLSLWVTGPLHVRLGLLQRLNFHEQSSALRPYIPCEFARKARGLDELDRWKAVEFRLFLFYTGPLLNLTLADDLYQNYLLLHAALSILVNRQLCIHADYAGELLKHFVAGCANLYGEEHMSFNVHCLLHLPDDVKHHGALLTASVPFLSRI